MNTNLGRANIGNVWASRLQVQSTVMWKDGRSGGGVYKLLSFSIIKSKLILLVLIFSLLNLNYSQCSGSCVKFDENHVYVRLVRKSRLGSREDYPLKTSMVNNSTCKHFNSYVHKYDERDFFKVKITLNLFNTNSTWRTYMNVSRTSAGFAWYRKTGTRNAFFYHSRIAMVGKAADEPQW